MKGYTYILLCLDGSFYTGSINIPELHINNHQSKEGTQNAKDDFRLNWSITRNTTRLRMLTNLFNVRTNWVNYNKFHGFD